MADILLDKNDMNILADILLDTTTRPIHVGGDFIKNKKMIKLILFLKKNCDRLRHKFSYKVFIALKYFCFVTSFY